MDPIPFPFFGPWRVTAGPVPGPESDFPDQILLLLGTTMEFGRYHIPAHSPLVFPRVDGAGWTLGVELRAFNGAEPQLSELKRNTEFVPGTGLVVSFEGAIGLKIRCVSLDPLLSPPFEPPPFDFTIPDGRRPDHEG